MLQLVNETTYPEVVAAAVAGVTLRQLGHWRRELGILEALTSQQGDEPSGWGGARKAVFYSAASVCLARFYAALLAIGVTAGELEKKFGSGCFREVPGLLFPSPSQTMRTDAPARVSNAFLVFGHSRRRPYVVSLEAQTTEDGLGIFRAAPLDLAAMSAAEFGNMLITIGRQLKRAKDAKQVTVLLRATVAAIGREIEAGSKRTSGRRTHA